MSADGAARRTGLLVFLALVVGFAVRLFVRKAAAMWSPVVNPAAARWGVTDFAKALLYGVTFVAMLGEAIAAASFVPHVRADLAPCLAAATSFTMLAAVFWGQSRFLAPLHPVGIALGAAWIVRRRPGAAP